MDDPEAGAVSAQPEVHAGRSDRKSIVNWEKIKKQKYDTLQINTVKTVDILKFLGESKKEYKLVGFALESENEIDYAKEKIKSKNLDLVVVNNPNEDGAGFGTDTNIVKIIDKKLEITSYNKMSKFDVSMKILDKVLSLNG